MGELRIDCCPRLTLCPGNIRANGLGKGTDVTAQKLLRQGERSGSGRPVASTAPAPSPRACEKLEGAIERMHEQGWQAEGVQPVDQIAARAGQAHDRRGQQHGHDLQTHQAGHLKPAQIDRNRPAEAWNMPVLQHVIL